MSDQQYRWDGDFDEGNLRSNLGRIFNRLGITDDPYGVADEVVPYFKPVELNYEAAAEVRYERERSSTEPDWDYLREEVRQHLIAQAKVDVDAALGEPA